jgi:hypothetical protein
MQAFPALYDWVSFPINILIKDLYEKEMKAIRRKALPDPYRLELIASLERLLCFCHTGSTAVFTTSLMAPLGLSSSAIADGFPMLGPVFMQPSILSAMNSGYELNPKAWPEKDGYPAVSSKKCQIFSYSLPHFMVSKSHLPYLFIHLFRCHRNFGRFARTV